MLANLSPTTEKCLFKILGIREGLFVILLLLLGSHIFILVIFVLKVIEKILLYTYSLIRLVILFL